jgi:hypothetical protein
MLVYENGIAGRGFVDAVMELALVFEKAQRDSGGFERREVRPVLCLCASNWTKKSTDKAESCGDAQKAAKRMAPRFSVAPE